MAISIKNFTAEPSQMEILIESDAGVKTAILVYTDGTTEDITSNFSETQPGEYSATIAELNKFTDGVFTLDFTSNTDENLIVGIANLLKGNQALLDYTLKEKYDCVLLQQLEACRQLILAVQAFLAADLYQDILNKVASCSTIEFEYQLEKTSIWIEDGQFVII